MQDAEVRPADAEVRPADAEVRPADAEVRPADAEVRPADAEVRPADGEVRPATDILHDPKLIKRTKPPEHYIMAKWGGDSKPRRVTGCTQSMSKNYIAIVAAIYVKIRDTVVPRRMPASSAAQC